MSDQPVNQSRRPWEYIGLALILVLAAILRFHHIGERAFWMDELFSLESIIGGNVGAYAEFPRNAIAPAPSFTHPVKLVPWWRLLRPAPQDIHPPLYYVLLRGWADVFGFAEAGLRSFCAVASLVAIFLLYEIVR